MAGPVKVCGIYYVLEYFIMVPSNTLLVFIVIWKIWRPILDIHIYLSYAYKFFYYICHKCDNFIHSIKNIVKNNEIKPC